MTREFSPTEHLIRVKKEAKDVSQEAEKIRQAVTEGLGDDYTLSILQTDSVGMATVIYTPTKVNVCNRFKSLADASLYSIALLVICIRYGCDRFAFS